MTISPVPERFAYSISEVATLLHLSRTMIYELIRSGQLGVFHVGRSVRVPRSALAQLPECSFRRAVVLKGGGSGWRPARLRVSSRA